MGYKSAGWMFAINTGTGASTFVGFRVAGLIDALVATTGCIVLGLLFS